MIVAIHQPNYLPWLGVFSKIACSDIFVLLDNVQFEKNGYQNRVKIKTQAGGTWLTIPVNTAGKLFQNINEVEVDRTSKWCEKHWKTLLQNYGKSAYWKKYAPALAEFYEGDRAKLAELNEALMKFVCGELGITTPFVRGSDLNVEGKSTDLLIAICEKLGADTYVSGLGGANYMEEEKFAARGIDLEYSSFKVTPYFQLHGGFVPGLSVVDALLNLGPKARDLVAPNGN